MSVAKYRDKFTQLSRYAPNKVADDADKQRRFLKGLYDGLQLQLMSNTYHNFQTLVNRAIVIDNKRKEMETKKRRLQGQASRSNTHLRTNPQQGFQQRYQGPLINGIATRTSNVHRTSIRMAINVPSSRVANRHHAREHLITLP